MFEELLKKIAEALERYNIPYMIIGGQAVLLYGEPRLTRDIDITLGIDIGELQRVLSVVRDLGFEIPLEEIESFVQQTMVLPAVDKTSRIRIDFIFSFTPYEREAIRRARKIKILGQEVSFASVEDVIIHKIFAGRDRDIEDIKNILIKNPDIDAGYIEKWLREFDRSLDTEFLQRFEEIRKTAST